MNRLQHAWRVLEREQRLAALAAIGLFVSMFLPWYSKDDTFIEHGAARATQTSLSAFQAFSFVEAAVLLVSAGILAMLFARAEEREFQLPGGDGTIVLLAGAWAALLVFYRLLDKPGLQASQRITATVGVEWGIFIALLLALALLYAGQRIRAEERPEPPLMRPRRGSEPREPESGGRPRGTAAGEEAPSTRRGAEESARPEESAGPEARTTRLAAGRERPGPGSRPEPAARRPVPARSSGGAPVARQAAGESPARRAGGEEPAGQPRGEDVAGEVGGEDRAGQPAGEDRLSAPAAGGRRPTSTRPRYPPSPSEQMSFEDPPSAPPRRGAQR